jgi:hypothetical protein
VIAKGISRAKRRRRERIRRLLFCVTGSLRILMTSMYLRGQSYHSCFADLCV